MLIMFLYGCLISYFFFFFSSRRRHTRLQGDWSSDVCSSDLLVMAATLIYLKSKLLVPPDETQEEQLDEDGLALRLELEARLREYARVKALGEWLSTREAAQALIWGRPSSTLPPPEEVPLEDLSVHLIERTLRRLIEEQARQRPRQVEPNPPSVVERMTMILSVLRDTWSLLFS